MRRLARWDDLPAASHPLVQAMVEKRLLVKDTRDGQTVAEVALESLLRQWRELAAWLRDEAQDLKDADSLVRIAEDWRASGRDPAWLLGGTRLADAEALVEQPGFRERLQPTRDFLLAAREQENDRVQAEKQRREAELQAAREKQEFAKVRAAERRAWNLGKKGEVARAAAALERLIDTHGGSSERFGLLAGRYKDLMRIAATPADRYKYLDLAIDNYEKSMSLDLNDYYPSSNLPRLYRYRGGEDDLIRADQTAMIATEACRRAIALGIDDEWIRATLMGMAFFLGDVRYALHLKECVEEDGPNAWKLELTLRDLSDDVDQQSDPDVRSRLTALIDELRTMLPPGNGPGDE